MAKPKRRKAWYDLPDNSVERECMRSIALAYIHYKTGVLLEVYSSNPDVATRVKVNTVVIKLLES
jgi:hypothetical protein